MQPGMVVSDETFRKHLTWLSHYLKFARLLDVNKYCNKNQEPVCIITIDDGWVDNYKYAFPILKELNTPATIFLVSNMIDTENYFWPEKLGLLLDDKNTKKLLITYIKENYGSELTGSIDYDALIELLKSKSDATIIEILKVVEKEAIKVGSEFCSSRQVLNLNELVEMKQSGLIDYGSHTANHVRLDKVNATEVAQELTGSKKQLETLLKEDIVTFCYPNGSYTPEVLNAVSNIYELACTTDKGWVDDKNKKYALKRILLHDDVSNTQSLFWGRVLGVF